MAHIADIHFRTPDCLDPDSDPDRPFRTRMIQDVRSRIRDLGPVDALLVGGDIAFKGDAQEYEVARAWLGEFADACGCRMERVFVVPGNHDVDRTVIASSTSVRNVQTALIRAQASDRERELREQFSDLDSGRALVAPLQAYNEFAKLFHCQVFPPDRLFWKQSLPLERGIELRIYGLTSTLLSGANGTDSTRGRLYLSPLQTVLDPVDDVVNVVLCHHPPDWVLDQDDVEDALRDRAAIQLFGHKHRARIDTGCGFIRCSAGAVNPDRYESNWQPGYNLINIGVRETSQDRMIEVDVYVLQWQTNPECFRPNLSRQGEPVYRHRIAIPRNVSTVTLDDCAANSVATPAIEPEADEELADNPGVSMGQYDTRNLVFRFWGLTVSQRREIALDLGLIQREELKLPEPERYGRALARAAKRNLLDQIAHEVALRENQ